MGERAWLLGKMHFSRELKDGEASSVGMAYSQREKRRENSEKTTHLACLRNCKDACEPKG